jgi:predicted nucleic acid-binding protein
VFLVDTSAWIAHFGSKDPFDLRSVCSTEERVLCLPVYQEILQGIRDESAFRAIKASLNAAPWVDELLVRERYLEAAELYRVARRQGITIRSGQDCLIAAIALKHALSVLHRDRDYPSIARVCGLEHREI